MNDEFDFEADDFDLDDFPSDEDDFDEFDFEDLDNLELQEVSIRTAILRKNNMLALLCIKTATQGGAICRVDPREPNPAVQLYDDPAKALEWFTKSLRTSLQNGWSVVYDGLPLKG